MNKDDDSKSMAAAADEEEDRTSQSMMIEEGEQGDEDAVNSLTPPPPVHLSHSELISMLSERHVLNLSPEEDELLDPIERTVRFIVPIPKHYYWDVVVAAAQNEHPAVSTNEIPWSIKVWHHAIASCATVGAMADAYVAQPIASFFGLTGPRFHEVLNSMTQEEMEDSARSIRERRLPNNHHRNNSEDHTA